MMFELIHDLTESRTFRSESYLEKFDSGDRDELLYAYILSVTILLMESNTRPWAKEYLGKTLSHGSFKRFVSSATDLYVLAYNQRDNKYLSSSRLYAIFNDMKLCKMSFMYTVLGELQRVLSVKEYKLTSIKRTVGYWSDMPTSDKKHAVTTLQRFIKLKMPYAEILEQLDKIKG